VYATFPNTQFVTGPEMCPRDDVGDPGGNKLASETESQIEVPIVPDRLALNGNAPNPFNAGTSIRLNVALPGQVHVDIFDVLGRRVRQLVSSFAGAGAQSIYWDGQTDAGKSVGTGVYFYRVNDGVTSVTSKMMVIK